MMIDVPVSPDQPVSPAHFTEQRMEAIALPCGEGRNQILEFCAIRIQSEGGVPPWPCSISGRVATPCGQGRGVCSATHLKTVRLNRLLSGLAYFSPVATRKESFR